ncbi:MAG: HECT-type E3 ubiquitin-protein ligase, partial [Promethearchaeia archaeon]
RSAVDRETFVCPLFVQQELSQKDANGVLQLEATYLLPNPSCDSKRAEELYEFLGQLMGASVRSGWSDSSSGTVSAPDLAASFWNVGVTAGQTQGEKLPLSLPPLIWKLLLGHGACWEDFAALEPELESKLRQIENATDSSGRLLSEDEFDQEYGERVPVDFTVEFDGARPPCTKELVPRGASINLSYRSRIHYVLLQREAQMHKYDIQIRAMRRGLLQYLSPALLQILNGYNLELAVAGEPEVSVDRLRTETRVRLPDQLKTWFWNCVEAMTSTQRSKLLRFATGRSRLPTQMKVTTNQSRNDGALPISHTCSFELEIPHYSSQAVMLHQLTIAIETESFGFG